MIFWTLIYTDFRRFLRKKAFLLKFLKRNQRLSEQICVSFLICNNDVRDRN